MISNYSSPAEQNRNLFFLHYSMNKEAVVTSLWLLTQEYLLLSLKSGGYLLWVQTEDTPCCGNKGLTA